MVNEEFNQKKVVKKSSVGEEGMAKVAAIVKEINIIKENWQALLGDYRKCALRAG